MEEMTINWLAFAAAVVAQMAVGYIWFHPSVMGKMWAKANGMDVKDMQPKNAGITYGLTFLLTLLFTLWLVTNITGPGQEDAQYHTFQHGLAHAAILSLMIMLPVFGTPALFEKRGWNWVIVHVGYWFTRMAVAGGILSLWR